jgi:hypothetical protein
MNDTRSVSLQAGDNSQQIGVVHGDVNYYLYYGSPRAGDDHVDLDWYRTSIQNRFSEWKSKYTLLDLNPVVSVLGNDWKSIDGAEMTLKETIARSQRLVLLGGAGSGKTTSLRFLAYSITSDPESLSVGNHDEPNVCLLIDLTRFRLQQGLAPVQLILVLIGEVLHASSQANPPSLAAIHRLLSDQQHLILFFDGLNEVPFDAKLSCWNGIADLAQKYPRHRFVVTTRPYGFRPREGWNMAELQALKREQIPDFLTRYIDSATAFSLARVLQDNPLARVPLFLDYVAKLSQTGTPLGPTVNSKSGLIGSYVDRLISRDTPDSAKPSYFEDTSVLQSALISLAERANTSGQSIAFNVAVMLLERTEQVDRDTATNIIEELLVRTVLVRDGQSSSSKLTPLC